MICSEAAHHKEQFSVRIMWLVQTLAPSGAIIRSVKGHKCVHHGEKIRLPYTQRRPQYQTWEPKWGVSLTQRPSEVNQKM